MLFLNCLIKITKVTYIIPLSSYLSELLFLIEHTILTEFSLSILFLYYLADTASEFYLEYMLPLLNIVLKHGFICFYLNISQTKTDVA